MKKILVSLVLIPAAVLIAVTVLRAWLEINAPESAKFASANILSLVWMVVAPAIMLRRGLSLPQGLFAGFAFFLLHRVVIGAVYAMAWSEKWTVAGSDTPVRYVADMQKDSPDASATLVFLGVTFLPIAFGLVFLAVLWTLTWALAFRKTRGLVRATEPAAS